MRSGQIKPPGRFLVCRPYYFMHTGAQNSMGIHASENRRHAQYVPNSVHSRADRRPVVGATNKVSLITFCLAIFFFYSAVAFVKLSLSFSRARNASYSGWCSWLCFANVDSGGRCLEQNRDCSKKDFFLTTNGRVVVAQAKYQEKCEQPAKRMSENTQENPSCVHTFHTCTPKLAHSACA